MTPPEPWPPDLSGRARLALLRDSPRDSLGEPLGESRGGAAGRSARSATGDVG